MITRDVREPIAAAVAIKANNDFVPLSSAPVTSDCSSTATRQCAYDVTSSGKGNIPDQSSYTGAEIDTYVSHGWLTPASGSSDALYQP
ncbi:MAG: hypothetical protein ACHQIM_21305 [Sphingobacteriales bacterium]